MQIERLPSWIHREIDRSVRKCGWGSLKDRRGVHLIWWDTLIKPKKFGGARLKATSVLNWAFLAKLACRVLMIEGEIWCDVLRANYGVKDVEVLISRE